MASEINRFDAVLFTVTVLTWGTTWFVILGQLGVVHPIVSVGWRFLLAAGVVHQPKVTVRDEHVRALENGLRSRWWWRITRVLRGEAMVHLRDRNGLGTEHPIEAGVPHRVEHSLE